MKLNFILLCTILAGCAGGPSIKNHSDIAQLADVATTFTALEVADGLGEANPIMEPLTGSPLGYVAMVGLKLGINTVLRRSEPRTCVQGIRFMTSSGFALGVSNGLLALAGVSNPVGMGIGLAVGLVNWFRNDNFIAECKLEEKYPEFDIYEGWRQGKLFGEGVRRGD